MLSLSLLVKTLKEFALNRNISDEEFLNALLMPYIEAGKIKNKTGEDFYLNKQRTSALLRQKIDVPEALRRELSRFHIKEDTKKGMEDFCQDYIVEEHSVIQHKLLRLISESKEFEIPNDQLDNTSLYALLTDLLLRAISEKNTIEKEEKILWKHGRNTLKLLYGDLFSFGFNNRKKRKNIIVIPVNNAFDTVVTSNLEIEPIPIVSEMTIHGQWLIRMQQSGESEEELYSRISDNLRQLGFSIIGQARSSKGRENLYPIGSLAILESRNAAYFLLAISEFDENNVAHSDSADIEAAIITLLDKYNAVGQGYDMYLPLLGTGRSRAGLSNKEAYQLLKNSLLSHMDLMQGNITIVVRPEDKIDVVN